MKNYLYLTFSKKKLSLIFQTLPDEAAMNLAVTYSEITDQATSTNLKFVADIMDKALDDLKYHISHVIIDTTSIREMNFIATLISVVIKHKKVPCFDAGFAHHGDDKYGIFKSVGDIDSSVVKNASTALSIITKKSGVLYEVGNPLLDGLYRDFSINRESDHNFRVDTTEMYMKLPNDPNKGVKYRASVMSFDPSYITFKDQTDGTLTTSLTYCNKKVESHRVTQNGHEIKIKINLNLDYINRLRRQAPSWKPNVTSIDVLATINIIEMNTVTMSAEITSGAQSGLIVKDIAFYSGMDINFLKNNPDEVTDYLENFVFDILKERWMRQIKTGKEPSKAILFPIKQDRLDDDIDLSKLCLVTTMLIRMGFGPVFK